MIDTARIIAIANQKGGVGKSLLTFNIAVNMANRGAKVLIIDLDPEACITNLIINPRAEDQSFATVFEVLKHDLQFKDVIEPSNYEGIDIVGCRGVARRAERLVSDQNPKKILKDKMEGLDKYDLILLDIMLPGINGFDLTRILKNDNSFKMSIK